MVRLKNSLMFHNFKEYRFCDNIIMITTNAYNISQHYRQKNIYFVLSKKSINLPTNTLTPLAFVGLVIKKLSYLPTTKF